MSHNTPLGQKAKGALAKGELVPDEVTIGMSQQSGSASREAAGFIFDGFPRTIPQAQALDRLMEEEKTTIHALLALQVDDEEIIQRIKLRGATSGRSDDSNEKIIQYRIDVYKSETTPVFDYYAEQHKSHRINGVGTVEEIFERLCRMIDTAGEKIKTVA